MRSRMRKSSVGFWRNMFLWKHPLIDKKHKLRMFRRHVHMLEYAGAETWILDDKAMASFNHWAGSKGAAAHWP